MSVARRVQRAAWTRIYTIWGRRADSRLTRLVIVIVGHPVRVQTPVELGVIAIVGVDEAALIGRSFVVIVAIVIGIGYRSGG